MKIVEPYRIERTYEQHIEASPDDVFPLLCPVREAEWVPQWDPSVVITHSGVIEPGCVFVTRAEPSDAIWVVTRHEPDRHRVEFIKVTPGLTVGRIRIHLVAEGEAQTRARISYMHTALSPQGEEFVDSFSEPFWREFMQDWETRLNDYLGAAR